MVDRTIKHTFGKFLSNYCTILSGASHPAYIASLLTDPAGVIPGTAMEDKDLWPEEVNALTTFLSALGKEPVQKDHENH